MENKQKHTGRTAIIALATIIALLLFFNFCMVMQNFTVQLQQEKAISELRNQIFELEEQTAFGSEEFFLPEGDYEQL